MSKKPASKYDVDILRRIEDTTLNDQGLARDAQILNDFKPSDSEIRCFFKGKGVLITGATGFVGKILLEKLLRSCPEIATVFLLIRENRGKHLDERIDEFLNQTVFERLQKERPNYRRKIIAIEGDIEKLNLGISEENREKIQQHVSIIFHAAANVRFDEPLRKCVLSNVRGTGELLKLAAGCARLESIVHFSTAFSNCVRNEIYEEFYEPPIKPIDLLNLVENTDEATLKLMTPGLLGKNPNTYIYSKAVTEEVINQYGRQLPICVFRPSIVVATYKEPIRGWADSIYGLTGILIAAGIGLMHTFYCDGDKVADIVPVDLVANAAITCAWRTAVEGVRSGGPLVYNYVSSPQKPITWTRIARLCRDNGITTPTVHAIWYYSFILNKNWYKHMLSVIFFHYLPALFMDVYSFVLGKEVKMMKTYRKIECMNKNLSFFTIQEWKFSNMNIANLWKKLNRADQQLFNFNVEDLEWERHSETVLSGVRVYILKDPFSTLPEARKKWQRLKYLHIATKLFFYIFVAATIGYLLMKIVM